MFMNNREIKRNKAVVKLIFQLLFRVLPCIFPKLCSTNFLRVLTYCFECISSIIDAYDGDVDPDSIKIDEKTDANLSL